MAEETVLSLALLGTPRTGVVAIKENYGSDFDLNGVKSGRGHSPVRERRINMQRLSPNPRYRSRTVLWPLLAYYDQMSFV